MKKIIRISFVVAFIFSGIVYVQAQSPQANERAQEKQKTEKKDKQKDKKKDASEQKGHAYGKDKELTGREFGMKRAEEARNKVQETNTVLIEATDALSHNRDKLEVMKFELEEKRKSRKASEAELKELDDRIQRASLKLEELNERLRYNRSKVVEIERDLVKTIDEIE